MRMIKQRFKASNHNDVVLDNINGSSDINKPDDQKQQIVLMQLNTKTGTTWTYTRSFVPVLLAEAGVPDTLWQQTHDEAVRHAQEFTNLKVQVARIWPAWGTVVVFLVVSCVCFENDHLVLGLICWIPVLVFLEFARRWKVKRDKHMGLHLEWEAFVGHQVQADYDNFGILTSAFTWTPTTKHSAASKPKVIIGGIMFTKAADVENGDANG